MTVKVILQYCTAHPVLGIITCKKYNGGFPCQKARTQEKWAFWKGMVGKKRWQGKKRQLSESVEIVENAKHPSFLSRTWWNILNQRETSTGAIVLSS